MFKMTPIAGVLRSVSLDDSVTDWASSAKIMGKQVSIESGYSSLGNSSESLNEKHNPENFKLLGERDASISSGQAMVGFLTRSQSAEFSAYEYDYGEIGELEQNSATLSDEELDVESNVEDWEGFEFDRGSESTEGTVLERWGSIPDKKNAVSKFIDEGDFDNAQLSKAICEADDWSDDENDISVYSSSEGRDKFSLDESELDRDSDLDSISDASSDIADFDGELEEESNERQVQEWTDKKTGRVWVERMKSIEKGEKGKESFEEEKRAFIEEAKKEFDFLVKIDHPNLVKMLGAEIQDYDNVLESVIAMEDAGTPLVDVVKSLAKEEQVSVLVKSVTDMMDGLIYLHGENILHRDIKPDNLLVDSRNKKLTIIDLGLAEDCSEGFPSNDTGSSMYAAPEAKNEQLQSFKSDIYAAGRSILEVMLDIGTVDLGWLRQKKDQNDPPVIHDDCKDDLRVISLLEKVSQMINTDPDERPNAKQIRALFKDE